MNDGMRKPGVSKLPVSERAVPNARVRTWLNECAALCEPVSVRVLDGSAAEKETLLTEAVAAGVLIPLNQKLWPRCYLHRSNPNDVARTEHLTFICTPDPHLAGPTNNWMESGQAYAKLRSLFAGSMRGRTMYAIPFVMGPPGSPLAKVGVQVTDSLYVALSMVIMTRVGPVAWDQLGQSDDFTRCLHGVGDCDPARRYICHFPLDNTIWSFGSGYGGNALLGKKCLALRIAGYLGHQQGWMAEHMLLMGVTSPRGDTTYLTGAFPSACGKTNFAMMVPPERYRATGWKIHTLGDDIVWMYVSPHDCGLWAVNPEAGYFGVVPGTSAKTNPNAMEMIRHDTIFTNVALLPDGDIWWEGKTDEPPANALDWRGQPWTPDCGRKAAHPNSRFTTPMNNNPAIDPRAHDPAGVPISGIIFGGRRSQVIPLVYQAFNWGHGVYLGAMLGSETTAAATGQVGVVRRDPMAMLPFCGYNMGMYFEHWLHMRRRIREFPRIFHVNWFRRDADGRFLWPGFGDNMRVLQWIVDRCRGRAEGRETPLGWVPRASDIDLEGIEPERFEAAQDIDREAWQTELAAHEELFVKLGQDMPKELAFERELLKSRL